MTKKEREKQLEGRIRTTAAVITAIAALIEAISSLIQAFK